MTTSSVHRFVFAFATLVALVSLSTSAHALDDEVDYDGWRHEQIPVHEPDRIVLRAVGDGPAEPSRRVRNERRAQPVFVRTSFGLGSAQFTSEVYEMDGASEERVDLSGGGCCVGSLTLGFDRARWTPHVTLLGASFPGTEEAEVARYSHGTAGMAGMGLGLTRWWIPDRLWTSATVYLPWLHVVTFGAFTAGVVLPVGLVRGALGSDDEDPFGRDEDDDFDVARMAPDIDAPLQVGYEVAIGFDQPLGDRVAIGVAGGVSGFSRSVPMYHDLTRIRHGRTVYGLLTFTVR